MEVAIIGAIVALALANAELARRVLSNGKPVQEANPSTDEHRFGDMSVTYVNREFDRLHEGLKEGFEGLDGKLEAILEELRKER